MLWPRWWIQPLFISEFSIGLIIIIFFFTWRLWLPPHRCCVVLLNVCRRRPLPTPYHSIVYLLICCSCFWCCLVLCGRFCLRCRAQSALKYNYGGGGARAYSAWINFCAFVSFIFCISRKTLTKFQKLRALVSLIVSWNCTEHNSNMTPKQAKDFEPLNGATLPPPVVPPRR